MKIFITGATGYIGSVITEKLLQKGYEVVGLARSESSAQKLRDQGAEVIMGDLDDHEVLTTAAGMADGVIHAAFKHDSASFLGAMVNEGKTVEALLKGISNSDKPLVYTSGTGMLGDTGTIVYDETIPDPVLPDDPGIEAGNEMVQATVERIKTERAVLSAVGVRGIVLRPPNVYGRSNGQALLTHLIQASAKINAVPFADFSRDHLWSFVHVEDLADLYIAAIEKSKGSELYYTGAQKGLTTKSIAEALSAGLGYKE